ncbi:uncharacterized protein [Periplaneta americana]|uniref:uncharacterized protein n=1 Tax=Periplaneta americana TaxID=6978 RepID=UPI0037E92356
MCESKTDFSESDFQDNCRLCLSSVGPRLSIFSSENSLQSDVSLPERILHCVSVDVTDQRNLPTLICFRCLYKVNEYYEFREVCKKTDLILRECFSKVKLKSEPDMCQFSYTNYEADNSCDGELQFIEVHEQTQDIGLHEPELFEIQSDEEGIISSQTNTHNGLTQSDVTLQQSEVAVKNHPLPSEASINDILVDRGIKHTFAIEPTIQVSDAKVLSYLDSKVNGCIQKPTVQVSNAKVLSYLDSKVNGCIQKPTSNCKRKIRNPIPDLVQMPTSVIKKSKCVDDGDARDLDPSESAELDGRYRCKQCHSCWATAELLRAHELRAHQPSSKTVIKAANSPQVVPKSFLEAKINGHYLSRDKSSKLSNRNTWCVMCLKYYLARQTEYRCAVCPSKPGLCLSPCFLKYHQTEEGSDKKSQSGT